VRWSTEHGMTVRRHGAGPAVVWLHGLGEQSASFDPVTHHPTLAALSHVLVDLPGYGRSAWPPEGSTLDALADHLVAWIASQPPAILVGHSMGGVLATLVAERTAVRGVVNIDGNLSRGDCNFSAQALPYTAQDFAAHGFATVRDGVYEAGLRQRPLRGYHAAMCLASPHQFHANAVDLVRLSETETLALRLARLACPHLYVAGVPDGVCERSRALLEGARVRWIGLAPAGHWAFLDQLDRFAELLAGFVAGA
jgi:pimeloyl-ACP methyl ester carboxylesterase